MDEKLYSVTNLSEELGISKQAVYKKIYADKDLKRFIVMDNNKLNLKEQGLKTIKVKMGLQEESTKDSTKFKPDDNLEYKMVDILTAQLTILEKELESKNVQLNNKDRQIEQQNELLKNMQILLKDSNDKFKLVESKVETSKQPFWKRLFLKN